MRSAGKYFLLSIIPLGVLAALISYYAVDIFMWDEWELISLLEKFHNGTLTLSDLFAQHNEHRIFLGKLFIIANAILTGWNVYYEIAINVLFAIGTSIVIFYAVEHAGRLSAARKNMLYFTCACLIFSFTQQANWLSGFQMQIFMAVFFALLTFAIIIYGGEKTIFLAVLSAVLASYSFASGVFVWPAGLVLLLLKKNTKGRIALWLIAAVLCMMLYFHDYSTLQPPFTEKLKYFLLQRPLILLFSSACYLGASLAVTNHITSILLGFVMIAIQVYCFVKIIRHKIRDKNILFWLGIDIFVILSALATGYGRPGIGGSMQTRYMTLCVLFPVATLGIASLTLDRISIKTYIAASMFIIALSFGDSPLREARAVNEMSTLIKQQLLRGEYDNRTFSRLYHHKKGMITRLAILKKYNVRNYENAPSVALDDFRPVDFTPERKITSCEAKISDVDDEFFDVGGWWTVDELTPMQSERVRVYIVLYNDEGAFEAGLYGQGERFANGWMVPLKYKDPYADYQKNNFSGHQIHYGSLPSGTYRTALKVADDEGRDYYYMMTEKISIDDK